jgi:hypothetical protein
MENTLYTDGHGIKVTTSEFVTGNTSYKIDGIIKAYMNSIRAAVSSAILFILIGLGGIITGAMHLYSHSSVEPFYIGSIPVTVNRIVFFAGLLFLSGGFILAFTTRGKYAVHIVTAEGDKEPVVSTKKEYIREIVAAIQKALTLK